MTDNDQNNAEISIIWNINQAEQKRRGYMWYALMGAIGVGLLIYAVVSANFLFALLILMFAMVIYLTSLNSDEEINIEISNSGIKVGDTFYPYNEINRFWFIYSPPEVKSLYLGFKSSFRPALSIPLNEENPNQIREVLNQFVPEDFTEDEEPLMDFLGRVLKL